MTSKHRSATPSTKPAAASRTGHSRQAEAPESQPATLLTVSLEAVPFDAEARQQLIAEAAYFHAAQRGFEPGHELDDWLSAESEVDQQLRVSTH